MQPHQTSNFNLLLKLLKHTSLPSKLIKLINNRITGELPKNTSEFFWFETNTWNLYFKPPPKQMMIVSANLR